MITTVLSTLTGTLLLAPGAGADTTFGGDPRQAITPGLTCSFGAPTGFGETVFIGTQNSPSCMWNWSNLAVGTDIVPIPVTGGSGTITSVTLPAMPNPGPMQVVVLGSALSAGSSPSQPDFICCQVKQVGPIFTVPANSVTTVPQGLRASATEAANLSLPGDTAFGDLVGISVLSPTASLPVRYTGATSVTNFDGTYAYYPAPGGPNGEFVPPYDASGFQMLASFTFALDGTGGPAAGPAATAAGGLKLFKKPVRVGANGRTVTFGRASNPPTATTTQRLTALGGAGAAAAKAAKPVVYGRGKTTVPAGKSAPVRLKLNRKARAKLRRKHKLKASLTVVSANAQGETQTRTRTGHDQAEAPQAATSSRQAQSLRPVGVTSPRSPSKAGRPSMLTAFFSAM